MSNHCEYENFFLPSEKWTELFLAHCFRHGEIISILSRKEIRSRIRQMLIRRLGTLIRRLKSGNQKKLRLTEGDRFIKEMDAVISDSMSGLASSSDEQRERQELLSLLTVEFRDWIKKEGKNYVEYDFLCVADDNDIYVILSSL